MRFDNFVSGSYQSWSPNVASDRAINLYPELVEAPGGKTRVAFYGTPGLATFCTLPTGPVRGLWAGEERLFAVGGSKLYEINSSGGIVGGAAIGDVGDDAQHTPVSIWPNGQQLLIVSAGKAWIATGTSVVQPSYSIAYGSVGTSGTAVQRSTGDLFTQGLVGSVIVINGAPYVVDSVADENHLTLHTSAGVQTGVTYQMATLGGDADVNHTHLTWHSGDEFSSDMVGGSITISGTTYTVVSVQNAHELTLSGDAGVGPAIWFTNMPVTARTGTFLDGYFIVNPPDSKKFLFSEQIDGTHWNPADFSVKEGYPDNIAALYSDHEELWLFGTHWSTEVWRNEGVADQAAGFVRDPGAFIHIGLAAWWSVASLASGLHFLGGDTRGRVVAYRAQGFQPVRISTHAVEQIWSKYSTVWDAFGYAYEEEGHQFWVLNFQTADATWVYDVATQMWHERAYWDGTDFHRHKGRCHAFAFPSEDGKGKHFLGAWDSGIIYQMSHNIYTDAGSAIRRVRVAPHLANEQLRVFHHSMAFDLEISSGAPSIVLDWSDDDTDTWSAPKTRSPSFPDKKRGRYTFNRLGSSRDRIYRLTISDPVKVAIVDALFNPPLTPGVS